jgi:NitT/TauT family transport system substrate-binding protein
MLVSTSVFEGGAVMSPAERKQSLGGAGGAGGNTHLMGVSIQPASCIFPAFNRRNAAVRVGWCLAVLVVLAVFAPARPHAEETRTIRIAQQYGIPFLPLTVMKEEALLEKAARDAGLPEPRVEWAQFANGTVMNEALISNNLDIASGIGPLITAWAKTRGNLRIAGVASLGSLPLILNTSNPAVRTIADFTDKDKIAVPAVKVSIQAVTLQMAAEALWGPGQQNRLDPLTVSMTHPDATIALLGGRSEITAHFANAPFQYQQLTDPRIHSVLNSYAVTGGPHTSYVVWSTGTFHDANPRSYATFLAALETAMQVIRDKPREAAAIYVAFEKSTLAIDFVEKIIRDPDNVFTTTPQNMMKFALFMERTGAIKEKPAHWTDLFFPELHDRPGS